MADLDSTQEIQILTANYNAEYGRSAGGQIRIVTKSGGRDFHGSLYEYMRNSAFNANEWGRNAATPASQPCDNPAFEKATIAVRRRFAITSSATTQAASGHPRPRLQS